MPHKFVQDDGTELALTVDSGWAVQRFDVGWVDVLDVQVPRLDDDGTYDETRRHGARTVKLELHTLDMLAGDGWRLMRDLSMWMHPSLRFWWVWSQPGGRERRMLVRPAKMSAPVKQPYGVASTVLLEAPDGVWRSMSDELVTLSPYRQPTFGIAGVPIGGLEGGVFGDLSGQLPNLIGRTYTLHHPRIYPHREPNSAVWVYAGSAPAWGTLRIYGPCTNPVVVFNGEDLLAFTRNGGIDIEAGHYLEVDCREHVVLLDGDADQSRFDRLEISTASWPRLRPGKRNEIRWAAKGWGAGAHVTFSYPVLDLW